MKRPPLWSLLAAALPLAGIAGYELWNLQRDPPLQSNTAANLSEHEAIQLDDEEEEADGGACWQSSECHPETVFAPTGERMLRRGRYCKKRDGECESRGKCAWNPVIVLDDLDPVCGCDGKTYGNSTHAATHGINVLHDGECPGAPFQRPALSSRGFDPRSVLAPLADAARLAGEKCSRHAGPTGRGQALVTFDASGRTSDVLIQGALAGTAVGACVERQFRKVVVPPFEGQPVSIRKSFFVEAVVH